MAERGQAGAVGPSGGLHCLQRPEVPWHFGEGVSPAERGAVRQACARRCRASPCLESVGLGCVWCFYLNSWSHCIKSFFLCFQNIPQSTEILKRLMTTNEIQSNIYT